MPIISLKCGVCEEFFNGTQGYAFYKKRGLCPKCKKKVKEGLYEKENKEGTQKETQKDKKSSKL